MPSLLCAITLLTACSTSSDGIDCLGDRLYPDQDGDGWGAGEAISAAACEAMTQEEREALASEWGDCDDLDPALHPEAPERCNGVDDDCDGQIDGFDLDGIAALWVENFDSFSKDDWSGDQWCYNDYEGTWRPEYDHGSATIAGGDYCWEILRTTDQWSPPLAICGEVTPRLGSGGEHADYALFALAETFPYFIYGDPYAFLRLEDGVASAGYTYAEEGSASEDFDTWEESGPWSFTLLWHEDGRFEAIGPSGSVVTSSSVTELSPELYLTIAVSGSEDGVDVRRLVFQDL